MNPVLNFDHVFKNFGKICAIDGIDLEVERGDRVALIGSNGAGKTSLLSMASGLRRPCIGKVSLFGEDPRSLKVKKRMSYLPQELNFPETLKVKEIIGLVKGHYKTSISDKLVSELNLKKLLNRKTFQLSGGERRKLGLICGLLSSPDLVILDEPTANIDVEGCLNIEALLKEYFKDGLKTLLFSSHHIKEIENLADKIVILKAGKIIAQGPEKVIKKQFGLKKISFRGTAGLMIESGSSQEENNGLHTVLGENSDQMIREILQRCPSASEIEICEPALDEILVKLWNRDETSVYGENVKHY